MIDRILDLSQHSITREEHALILISLNIFLSKAFSDLEIFEHYLVMIIILEYLLV